ncbi:hypothetical protein BpHYR1_044721, partial [Brachionus plicatilis]
KSFMAVLLFELQNGLNNNRSKMVTDKKMRFLEKTFVINVFIYLIKWNILCCTFYNMRKIITRRIFIQFVFEFHNIQQRNLTSGK